MWQRTHHPKAVESVIRKIFFIDLCSSSFKRRMQIQNRTPRLSTYALVFFNQSCCFVSYLIPAEVMKSLPNTTVVLRTRLVSRSSPIRKLLVVTYFLSSSSRTQIFLVSAIPSIIIQVNISIKQIKVGIKSMPLLNSKCFGVVCSLRLLLPRTALPTTVLWQNN